MRSSPSWPAARPRASSSRGPSSRRSAAPSRTSAPPARVRPPRPPIRSCAPASSRRSPRRWLSHGRRDCRSRSSSTRSARARLELVLRAPRAEHGAWRLPGGLPRAAARQGSHHLPRHGGALRCGPAGRRADAGRVHRAHCARLRRRGHLGHLPAQGRAVRAHQHHARTGPRRMNGDSGRERALYLPDFCTSNTTLAIVLIVELTAFVLSLARQSEVDFWTDLVRTSLFLLWIGLAGSGLLCALRGPLSRATVPAASAAVLALITLLVATVSVCAYLIGRTRMV